MPPERTELEWLYDPPEFFEAPYQLADNDFDLFVDGGRAVATLKIPQEPVSPELEHHVWTVIENVFLVRQVLADSYFTLEGPRIWQRSEGRTNISIRVGDALVVCSGDKADLIITDRAGKVIRDSRAERIAEHTSIIDSVAPKLNLSPTLRAIFESYSRSVADPENELVHLYEVRDALSVHYGGETGARNALSISKGDWDRLGVLANVEPFEQGRHRGKHLLGRREATETELNEACELVRRWIFAFAQTI